MVNGKAYEEVSWAVRCGLARAAAPGRARLVADAPEGTELGGTPAGAGVFPHTALELDPAYYVSDPLL